MKKKRVYIIDYDLVGPLGIGREQTFRSLEQNICAESRVQMFDPHGLPNVTAAEVKQDLQYLYSNESPMMLEAIRYDRKLELLAACYYVMESRLQAMFDKIPPHRAGVILGLGADVPSFEKLSPGIYRDIKENNIEFTEAIQKLNKEKVRINAIFNPIDVESIFIAEKLHLGAFQKTTLTACAASTQAIAIAYDAIVNDEADVVVAGGTDSIINPIAYMAFGKLGVLAENSTGAERSCRPFDINRGGALAGEAAGLCVLASEEVVQKMGLNAGFEFLGYGNTMDAYKITSPDPSGKGIKRAVESVLANAGLKPWEVEYVNLHGTGTRNNDGVELDAFMSVFGDHFAHVPASSTKDRHGHSIAAAGIEELVVLCESLKHNFIPCTLNLEKPIKTEGCDLVKGNNRYQQITTGITVNFAFGGINTALAIKKV